MAGLPRRGLLGGLYWMTGSLAWEEHSRCSLQLVQRLERGTGSGEPEVWFWGGEANGGLAWVHKSPPSFPSTGGPALPYILEELNLADLSHLCICHGYKNHRH